MKTLLELYGEHQGKVSDKWSIYLAEYNRLFSGFREQPVRMLEIGIQNGGSLEIWSKYFPKAQILAGCDINPDCAKLAYDDSRIQLVIGDANTDAVEKEILSHSTNFDLIIDDGSHTSSDIAKSFARYFRHLNEGGLFVAEDLHCSYWREFEGGLYYPYSSMAFFKRLADVVNHEHWGIAKERTQLLRGFSEKFSIEFDEGELADIHSIEFFNSVCVVRKHQVRSNVLGERFIAGQHEFVVQGHHRLSGPSQTPSQASNSWAAMSPAPEEAFASLNQTIADRDGQIANLNEAFAARERRNSDQLASMVSRLAQETSERAAAIASLNQAVADRDGQITSLNQAVAERDGQIAAHHNELIRRDEVINTLEQTVSGRDRIIEEIYCSESWRLTKPIRFLSRTVKKLFSFGSKLKPSKIRFVYNLAKPHLLTILRNPSRLRSKLYWVGLAWRSGGYKGVIERLKQAKILNSVVNLPHPEESVTEFMRKLAFEPDSRTPDESQKTILQTSARYRLANRPVVLFVTHACGGGTEKHVQELADAISQENVLVLFLRPSHGECGCDVLLESHNKNDKLSVNLSSQCVDLLANVLLAFGVTKVHIHHTIGFGFSVDELVISIGLPYDITIHDFYSICPRINLRIPNKGYCESPTVDDCNACLAIDPKCRGADEIIWWRVKSASLLNGADNVYCPSRDTANRILKHFPSALVRVIPHEHINLPSLRYTPVKKTRRIALLGVLAAHKGLALIEEALVAIENSNLPIEFVLIGYPERAIPANKAFMQTGPYNDCELPGLIEKHDPDAILFPALCPETYSYTLTAAISSGRAIVVSDIGSLPERVDGIANAFVYPFKLSGMELVDYLLTLEARLPANQVQSGSGVGFHV